MLANLNAKHALECYCYSRVVKLFKFLLADVGVKHMESFIPLWQWLWLGIQSLNENANSNNQIIVQMRGGANFLSPFHKCIFNFLFNF